MPSVLRETRLLLIVVCAQEVMPDCSNLGIILAIVAATWIELPAAVVLWMQTTLYWFVLLILVLLTWLAMGGLYRAVHPDLRVNLIWSGVVLRLLS